MTTLTYTSFDYQGGIRDGEYGVFLEVNGKPVMDGLGKAEFRNEHEALSYYVKNILGVSIEEDWKYDDE